MPHISYHLQEDVKRADEFLAEPHRRWLINKCWDAKKCDLLQTLNCSLSISTFRHTLKCRPASLDPNVKLYAVEVQERRYAIPHVWCIHHMFWLQFTQHTLSCSRTLPKMRGRNAKLPPKVVSAMTDNPRMTDEEINEKETRLWTDANLAKEYALSILLAWFYRDGLQSRSIYGINLESKEKVGILSWKGALTDQGFMSLHSNWILVRADISFVLSVDDLIGINVATYYVAPHEGSFTAIHNEDWYLLRYEFM